MSPRASGVLALCVLASSASAAVLVPGDYQLSNHPDGDVDPPPYGFRLDGLDGSADIFTVSFDVADGADMKLRYDDGAGTIRIWGTGPGGRDAGVGYAADSYNGTYSIDFTYTVGVGLVPSDDDLYVNTTSGSNFGTVTLPDTTVIDMYDIFNGGEGHTFRLGDEDDDLGHRGFSGISGWGWLELDGAENGARTRDWLFTAELIPAPGTALFLSPLALAAARRRRR